MPGNNSLIPVTFGSVTVLTSIATEEQVEARVLAGQQALRRVRNALIRPGVKLSRKDDVPLYYASPNDPNVFIREMNGVCETGRMVKWRFVADSAS